MYATISADVVSSTSLSADETIGLRHRTEALFALLEEKYRGFRGRMIKGDYVECLVPDVPHALRVALAIKSHTKSFPVSESEAKRDFLTYGLRIAIGIGGMRTVDTEHGIWDGEAIYMSGRALAGMRSLRRETLTVATGDEKLSADLNTVALLADAIMNGATQRQSEVFFYKLLGHKEEDIAQRMGIRQSGVNRHATTGKWYCVEEALRYFEGVNFGYYG